MWCRNAKMTRPAPVDAAVNIWLTGNKIKCCIKFPISWKLRFQLWFWLSGQTDWAGRTAVTELSNFFPDCFDCFEFRLFIAWDWNTEKITHCCMHLYPVMFSLDVVIWVLWKLSHWIALLPAPELVLRTCISGLHAEAYRVPVHVPPFYFRHWHPTVPVLITHGFSSLHLIPVITHFSFWYRYLKIA